MEAKDRVWAEFERDFETAEGREGGVGGDGVEVEVGESWTSLRFFAEEEEEEEEEKEDSLPRLMVGSLCVCHLLVFL